MPAKTCGPQEMKAEISISIHLFWVGIQVEERVISNGADVVGMNTSNNYFSAWNGKHLKCSVHSDISALKYG